MRFAVIVAPGDSRPSGAPGGSEAFAWLRSVLGRFAFQVVTLDGGADVEGRLERVVANVSSEDTVLVHVSGRVVRRGVLRTAGGAWLPMRTLGEALRACKSESVSVLAELVNEDRPQDPRFGNEHLASLLDGLGARERGYGVVAAVRSALWPIDRFAFTRLFLGIASAGGREGALLSATYARVAVMSERTLTSEALVFEPGMVDLELAPPSPAPEELEILIGTATDEHDWLRVVALRRARLPLHASARAQARELVCIARVLQSELDDAEGAVQALEEARSLEPTRIPVLQALRRSYERLGRWASAIEATGVLVGLAKTTSDRAELRFAQARMAIDHLQDDDRAIAWLEATLEDEPNHERARAALNEVLALRSLPDDAEAHALNVDALEDARSEQPTLNYEAKGDSPPAASEVDDRADADDGDETKPGMEGPTGAPPTSDAEMTATAFARAFAASQREGRKDRAFLQALSLEELGSANREQQSLIKELRSVAPIRARGTLDESGWALLRAPGSDEAMETLFGAVARAALEDRLVQLEASGPLAKLDRAARIDPTDTTIVARVFHWASHVLGVPCPDLYLIDQVPGDIAAVRAHDRSTAVGPGIVRGRSPKELAFVAGRHLTYYRPEHEVIGYYPTRDELVRLLFATVQIVRPSAASPEDSGNVAQLSARLARIVTDRERSAISAAVRQIQARGGKASVGSWTRGVELTATRAGLLLCGDLANAMARIRSESRDFAGLTVEEKRRDLIDFCASEQHAMLRTLLALTAPERTSSLGDSPSYAGARVDGDVQSSRL
jgi:hypothetical protein